MKPPPQLSDIRLASRVASRVAHDLNNVAAVLTGHIYLLRNSAESREEAFGAMEKAMEHLLRLTQSLGALGGVGLEEESAFDLNAVLKEMVKEAKGPADRGPVRLDLALKLPKIRGRKGDIQIAIDALLANAREATGPNADISISTRALSGGRGVAVRVEDSGGGIPPPAAERIFDPLFSTRGTKGRGIGLTLAAVVALLHGGSCEVERRPEGGTRAVLELRNARP